MTAPSSVAPLHVLFVDDEPRVLDGLRRALHGVRNRWVVRTACGGEEALRELLAQPADVVISDLRMPGMDGIGLLETIAVSWPATVRVILSGQEDVTTGTHAWRVAHQYLAKPSEARLIIAALDKAAHTVRLLSEPAMRAVAGCLSTLPTTPTLLLQLQQLTVDEGSAVGDLSALIARDPALTAKLLQLVNSAYFGVARVVTSIDQAINMIGFQVLRALIISQAITSSFPCTSTMLSADAEQQHALLVGIVAKSLGESHAERSDLFTAGVLHDVGKLVLVSQAPEMLQAALRHAAHASLPLHTAEMELHGVTHADVGAYLLGLWGLPWSLVEAVRLHHTHGAWGDASHVVPAKVAFAEALVEAGTTPAAMEAVITLWREGDQYRLVGDQPVRERMLDCALAALQRGGGRV